MKVYKKHDKYKFIYPDDMEKILNFLSKHGEIFVSDSTIEDLYFEFSNERYSASWVSVNERLLEEFTDWLDEYRL